MDRKIENCVVIVAAGRGSRMQTGRDALPKQYLKIIDRTVLHHSIAAFNSMPMVNAILTVIHPDDDDLYAASLPSNCDKMLPPVYGAKDRQGSVLNGLRALQKYDPDKVYIHDAARPFITETIMESLSGALSDYDGALPGLQVADTLKRANEMLVETTVPRTHLWRAQTPQAFHYERILAAHERAANDKADESFTDDASIAEWDGLQVALVQGYENNRKLTTPEDLEWARHLMERNMQQQPGTIRSGTGFDVHAFTGGDHVILCGIKIPHDMALRGHSDADVAMHALTDALFGAIADGDIGTHFPPSDPQWKGAASHIFLEHAIERIRKRGGVIQNVDITIMCETPKIGPHSEAMRERLSEIMNLPVDRISVKATTTEKLGFTGRREGIASMATASVWLP